MTFRNDSEPQLLHPKNEDSDRMFLKGGREDERINTPHEKEGKQTQAHVGQSVSISYFCCCCCLLISHINEIFLIQT